MLICKRVAVLGTVLGKAKSVWFSKNLQGDMKGEQSEKEQKINTHHVTVI